MATPITTLFPVTALPTCVSSCGVLYDVNGGCVPPGTTTAADTVYESCFCSDTRLTAWKTTTTDLCDGGCTATADLLSIEDWYTSYCNSVEDVVATSTSSSSSSTATSSSSEESAGQTWLQSHYQWVVFLVIMVVAITGIWIGSCIWRKRYLARKDRQYALGKNLAHATESGRVVANNTSAGTVHMPTPGMFTPAPISTAGVYDNRPVATEKPKKMKKKWIVKERT